MPVTRKDIEILKETCTTKKDFKNTLTNYPTKDDVKETLKFYATKQDLCDEMRDMRECVRQKNNRMKTEIIQEIVDVVKIIMNRIENHKARLITLKAA